MRRGSDVKSRLGTGIFWTTYSQMASMLYFSWADMGIMGAPSAIVPVNTKKYESEMASVKQHRESLHVKSDNIRPPS